MRRQLIDGVCDCDSCRRRRLWIAVRRAHKIAAELEQVMSSQGSPVDVEIQTLICMPDGGVG